MAIFIFCCLVHSYHQCFNIHLRFSLLMDLPVEHVLQPISQSMHSPVSGSCTCPATQRPSIKKPECISLKLRPTQKLCFTFTYVTGRCLADSVLEFVVFPTFGTYVAICAEFTIGYAGQAGIVTPVRIESPGAVCPTASLVKKTFLSIFI